MLHEFAKASEAEIWRHIRRRYLTSFAGLHFENEPGLTELDAAESRRNRLHATESQLPWILEDPFGPYVATLVKYRRVALIVWTNRNHFQVIAETGPTGQLHYDGVASK